MRSDAELLDHILNHINNGTTDLGEEDWHEPVENYASQTRYLCRETTHAAPTCCLLPGRSIA